MKQDPKDPVVVDLASRRKAARKAAEAARRRPVQASDEPLVGARPHARLILALLMAAALMFWIVPKLL